MSAPDQSGAVNEMTVPEKGVEEVDIGKLVGDLVAAAYWQGSQYDNADGHAAWTPKVQLGANRIYAHIDSLRTSLATATREAEEARGKLDAVIAHLGLEWCDLHKGWWVPGDPGPVMVESLEQALKVWDRMGQVDAQRDALEEACKAVCPYCENEEVVTLEKGRWRHADGLRDYPVDCEARRIRSLISTGEQV